jgi:pilus assembly protein CpaB
MGRRKILLPLAALIAAVGTLMVFLYVQGAESRADERYDAVEVLRAVKQIEPGESFDDAAKSSKFQLQTVASDQLLDGYQKDLSGLSGSVASQTIFPGEQITENKWGETAEAATSLAIPKGTMAVSVNLTDPGRVSGFVNPGSEVAVFYTSPPGPTSYTRLVLGRVTVLGIGDTSTITSTTTNDQGEETTAEIPRTLMTLAVRQTDAQKLFWGNNNGILSVGLITDETEEKTPSKFTNEPNLFE